MKTRGIAGAALLLAGTALAAPQETTVFRAGEDGYAFFRIPAALVTAKGTLLAFCEGRKHSRSDAGKIDLVLRRSHDGGKSWSPLQIVWADGENTCGNPTPVVDANTGRLWLVSTWNLGTDGEKMIKDGTSTDTRRVYTLHSDDDGKSWSAPSEITSSVKEADWRWYATGPCHAIQMSNGRIVVPANHSLPPKDDIIYYSHVIYSDDSGKTWRKGATVGPNTNECTVAELGDGSLYINMRSYEKRNRRAIAVSRTRGESWEPPTLDETLIEPVCQASVLRHKAADGSPLFFFSNPASTKREKMTVRASRDSCRTWNAGRLVFDGPAAYSDLCSLDANTLGLFYERQASGQAYGEIVFARLDVPWLLEEKHDTPGEQKK